MPVARHSFSHLDVDTDISEQPANAFQAAVNIHLEPGYVTAATGNVRVPYALPATGVNRRLGGFTDGATGTAVTLLYNSLGAHRLIRYDPATNTETTLLEWGGLHLTPDTVPQGGVLDGRLVFLDGHGELRSVNLTRAANNEYTPALLAADPYALHLVKQPPRAVPDAARATDPNTADPRTQHNGVDAKAWQFAFQYEYPDGVRTPLGPFTEPLPVAVSLGSPTASDGRNVVQVAYPSGTLAPPPTVKAVRLLVRAQGETAWQVAGTMSAGVRYDFYGATTGEVLTEAEAIKLFESVPVKAGAAAIAHSRVLAADCTEGYAPSWPAAALTATAGPLPTTGSTAITVYHTDTAYDYTYTGTDGVDRIETRQRQFDWQVVSGAYPNADSTYRQLTLQAGQYYANVPGTSTYQQAFVDFAADESVLSNRTITTISGTLAGTAIPPSAEITLHDGAAYPVGVAFYDAVGRTAGAEASRLVYTPAQNYASPAAQNIRWTLDPATPVPAWAVSYQLLLGPNRTASYFLQFKADTIKQYRGDLSTGAADLHPITETGFAFVKQVWVPLTALTTSGRGYVFEQGDRVKFPTRLPSTTVYTPVNDYPILGERLGYVAISAEALYLFVNINNGTLITDTPLVEIYRPVPNVEAQVLHERGPRYPIAHPGTAQAALTTTTGILAGDCSLAVSAGNALESMNPAPRDYELWLDASRGRPIAVVREGRQTRRQNLIRFSGVLVQGTLVNGLGQWDALNQFEELPQEDGAVVRLTVADQTQTDGSILLVNQTRGATSLSLGRGQIQTADGTELLTITKSVIGNGNTLRGGFGCLDPASVVPYAGKVFFWCAERAELLRYDRNGLTPLGLTYKARVRLETLARRYAGGTVRACFDPRRKELLLTFDAANNYDATSVVYSDRREAWADTRTCTPEAGLGVGNELCTFQDGALWRHTPTAPTGSFFGQPNPTQLTFSVAQPGGAAKLFQDVAVESKSLWLATSISTDTAQASQMLPAFFTLREGVYRGGLRRDTTTPGFATVMAALHNGRPLIGTRLTVTLTAPQNAQPLTAVSVSWTPRSGQKMSS